MLNIFYSVFSENSGSTLLLDFKLFNRISETHCGITVTWMSNLLSLPSWRNKIVFKTEPWKFNFAQKMLLEPE